MNLIKICESDDFIVDYDVSRGMYRLSVFEDGHFQDEYWFSQYNDRFEQTQLKRSLLNLLYEENVRCDSGIESLAEDIETIFTNFIADDWSVDDCK